MFAAFATCRDSVISLKRRIVFICFVKNLLIQCLHYQQNLDENQEFTVQHNEEDMAVPWEDWGSSA